jgi:RNA polymerase sigma-70 factor (ECF subfamily)
MLGSSHDGDDVVQETLLRAWRARESLRDPERLRPWLYRIATNECLDELKRRPKRTLVSDAYPPAADPRGGIAPAIEEPVWLEPMPDTWLEPVQAQDPSARYTLKESVALAFVAALQILSPVQRATLLLRDVIGLSAEEAAEALSMTVSAANSALFRARETVAAKLGGQDPAAIAEARGAVDEALLARYVRAYEEADMDALVSLLHADIETTMPPSPFWLRGLADNEAFFRYMFRPPRENVLRVRRSAANGHPAFLFYRAPPGAPLQLHAIQVVEIRDGAVARIDHFMTREVFPLFGAPLEIPAA